MLRNKKLLTLFSPFEVVRYRNGPHPDVRTLHTGLWEKVKDTYKVFHGSSGEEPRWGDAPGLIDYATLGTFRFSIAILNPLHAFMIDKLPEKKLRKGGVIVLKSLLAIPYTGLVLFHVLTNGIIRPVASAILTAVSFPAIFAAWGIAKGVRYLKARSVARNHAITAEEVEALEVRTLGSKNNKPYYSPPINDPKLFEKIASLQIKKISSQVKANFNQKLGDITILTFEMPEIHDEKSGAHDVSESYYCLFSEFRKNRAKMEKFTKFMEKVDKHSVVDPLLYKKQYGDKPRQPRRLDK